MQPAQFLKILVIVLGVAIVIAIGLVIYGFTRLGATGDGSSVELSSTAVMLSDLGQPVGTDILQIIPLNNSRVAVTLRGGTLPDRIVTVDLKTGRVVGTIFTSPPPAQPNP
ncbi:MAG: hypothetical protein EXR11_11650 [Rhodospirillaceae bacterium]|nr:hypothetical protein [Rhodospirillaceae bacterium]